MNQTGGSKGLESRVWEEIRSASVWMSVSSQNLDIEIIIINVTVLGGEVYERWLAHESSALMNENVIVKEPGESPITPSAM